MKLFQIVIFLFISSYCNSQELKVKSLYSPEMGIVKMKDVTVTFETGFITINTQGQISKFEVETISDTTEQKIFIAKNTNDNEVRFIYTNNKVLHSLSFEIKDNFTNKTTQLVYNFK